MLKISFSSVYQTNEIYFFFKNNKGAEIAHNYVMNLRKNPNNPKK